MKPYKIFTIGLLTGVIATCSTSAFAAIGDKVEAVFATFNYKVKGVEQTIDKNSLVVDGDSYLPVRVIANMLGYDVTYKADNRTIEFNPTSSFSQQSSTPSKPAPQEKPSSNVPQQQQQSSQPSPSVEDKYAGKVFVSGVDLVDILNKSNITIVGKSNNTTDTFFEYSKVLQMPVTYYEVSFLISSGVSTSDISNLVKYKVVNDKIVPSN